MYRDQFVNPILITFTLLFWLWFIPSGYLWELVKQEDIFLPILPRLSWFLPGFLWIHLRWLFIVTIFLLPVLFFLIIPFGKHRLIQQSFYLIHICLVLLLIISITWGILLLKVIS